MGCDASGTTNPKPQNFCGDGDTIGMQVDVEGACFFTTAPGDYCSGANTGTNQLCFGEVNGAVGPDIEWTAGSHSTGCGVCSSCNGVAQGSGNGLCGFGGGSCSWAGVKYKCRRTAFRGDPTRCCRRSRSINGNALFCFDKNNKKATCDPIYRGFDQPSCVAVMAAYCSNDTPDTQNDPPDPSTENMVAKWTGSAQTKDCLRFVTENQGKLNAYQPVIEAMVNRYLITLDKPITSVQSDGPNHDPFIDQGPGSIVQICRANPGACDSVLSQKCSGVTRDQLEQNINLANLCGCFMDDTEYAKFSQFGINRICDPVCVIGSSVKPLDTTSDPNNAKFLECKQSICVIDDITINILANSAVGDVTFAQACGSCASNTGAGSCRCYISDVTIQAVNSLIKDVNFQQTCGAPVCYKSNPTIGGPPIQVDCASGVAANTTTVQGTFSGSQNILWIVLGVLLVLLIIFILFTSATRTRKGREPIIVFPEQERATRPLISSTQTSGSLAGVNYVPRKVV